MWCSPPGSPPAPPSVIPVPTSDDTGNTEKTAPGRPNPGGTGIMTGERADRTGRPPTPSITDRSRPPGRVSGRRRGGYGLDPSAPVVPERHGPPVPAPSDRVRPARTRSTASQRRDSRRPTRPARTRGGYSEGGEDGRVPLVVQCPSHGYLHVSSGVLVRCRRFAGRIVRC